MNLLKWVHLPFVLFLLLALSGCAHQAIVPSDDISNLKGTETGLILPISLSGSIEGVLPPEGCKLSLKESNTAKTFPISIRGGFQTIFVELSQGSYTFSDLYCESNKTWDFSSKTWAPMAVLSGNVSAATPMDLRVDNGTKMTTFFFNRDGIQKTYRDIFVHLKPMAQKNIWSAYNHKEVTASMTQPSEYQINVKLPAAHLVLSEPDEVTYPEFKTCYSNEFNANPLYIGSMYLRAKYFKKALTKTEYIENNSIYSDQFKSCIESTLKNFQPNRSDELVYDINL